MKPYLCGPINGCTDEECRDWREEAKKRFPNSIDPMRRDYRGKEITHVDEIVELDKKDVDECDCLLVNHPQPSVGTSMEVLYAWQQGKYIVVVCPEGVKQSPWMIYHSNHIVHTFEEAYDLLHEHYVLNNKIG
jgi:nucleoside 2-deoxyribosyltransferase